MKLFPKELTLDKNHLKFEIKYHVTSRRDNPEFSQESDAFEYNCA